MTASENDADLGSGESEDLEEFISSDENTAEEGCPEIPKRFAAALYEHINFRGWGIGVPKRWYGRLGEYENKVSSFCIRDGFRLHTWGNGDENYQVYDGPGSKADLRLEACGNDQIVKIRMEPR